MTARSLISLSSQTFIHWGANLQILLMLLTLSCFSWWILSGLVAKADVRVFINQDISAAGREELAQLLAGKQRMTTLQHTLRQVPWVKIAQVRKDMQGRILIRIEPAQLLAYLPERGYLLASGDLVDLPFNAARVQDVPRMEAPSDLASIDLGEATRILPQLGDTLAQHGLDVHAYRVGRGGDLQVAIKHGPELIFGIHSHSTRLEHMRRFLLEYRQDLTRMQRIDLRHENALAVRWK